MTCRFDRLAHERGVILRVSGRIAGDDLDLLRAALDERGVVAVDLAEIELVDRDAVMFLAVGESSGIELTHCPAFIREWITRERCRRAEGIGGTAEAVVRRLRRRPK